MRQAKRNRIYTEIQASESEPERNLKKHHNTLKSFLLHGLGKYIPWFRCGAKGKHLNLEAMLNPTLNRLTTNALQDFRNRARGSDPKRVWNATDRKCAPEMLLAEVFQKGPTEQHRHLNRTKTKKSTAIH